MGQIIQVRDVPDEDAEVLRSRAASGNMSVSSYLRELIHDDTSQPTMTEALARIATREGSEASSEEIRALIDEHSW